MHFSFFIHSQKFLKCFQIVLGNKDDHTLHKFMCSVHKVPLSLFLIFFLFLSSSPSNSRDVSDAIISVRLFSTLSSFRLFALCSSFALLFPCQIAVCFFLFPSQDFHAIPLSLSFPSISQHFCKSLKYLTFSQIFIPELAYFESSPIFDKFFCPFFKKKSIKN